MTPAATAARATMTPTPASTAPATTPSRPGPRLCSSPAELYGRGLRGIEPQLVLREECDGSGGPVPVATYLGPLRRADHDLLRRAAGPVLDVGCGPGRHVVALLDRGVQAAGIDASPVAVQVARARGARVFEGSIFDALPAHTPAWSTALLLDGNIGIGGSPARLLARLRSLLAPGGEVLAELEAPGTPLRTGRVRLEGTAAVSPWFPWARVGTDAIDGFAALAGLTVTETWEVQDRWFARLASR